MRDKVEDPCQECRDRHLKCDDSHPRCKQCERLGGKCRRGKGKVKFRHGSSARYDAAFAKDQPWLEQTKNAKLQFVDQGPELENYYSHDDLVVNSAKATTGIQLPYKRGESSPDVELPHSVHGVPTAHPLPFVSPSISYNATEAAQPDIKRRRTTNSTLSGYQYEAAQLLEGTYDPIRSHYRLYDSPKVFSPVSPDGFAYMSDQNYTPKVVEAEYRRLADSNAALVPEEPLLSPVIWKAEFLWPNVHTTTQCACLMRYYIDHLAPWFDVGDPARHFTLSVPQRARRCPPLLNAIFTAASRHLASLSQYKTAEGIVKYQDVLLPKLTEDTALKYHNACIAYLKNLSSDPEYVRDEDLLAAAVILRYYEELDTSFTGEDKETFLHTFQVFVKAQATTYGGNEDSPQYLRSSSAAGGYENWLPYLKGFRHAVFRIALRQETTIAFLKQRAVRLPLETWAILRGFDKAEDFIWADRHLYHCANVLQFCFGEDSNSSKKRVEQWNELRKFEQDWGEAKPLSFAPIHYEEADRSKGECLPHIWYMAEVHVTGAAFLELARILLTVYDPHIPRIGPGATAARRRVGEQVHAIVIRLCGTAVSNPSSPPALVQAYMAVAVCGEYFSDRTEQIALLEILDRLDRDHGWPTGKTAMELKKAWDWFSGFA